MVINRLQSDRKIDNVVMIITHMVTNGIEIGYKMVEKKTLWYFMLIFCCYGYKSDIIWLQIGY